MSRAGGNLSYNTAMQTPTASRYTAFLTTWFDRVWTQQDTSAIDEMFVSEGKAHGLGGQPLIGPNEFRLFHSAMLELVDEVHLEVLNVVEDEEWFSYFGVFHATCRRTGKPVSMQGGAMCRMKDGKMTEAYNAWDFLHLFGDLGLAPEDAFERAMAGQPVCDVPSN